MDNGDWVETSLVEQPGHAPSRSQVGNPDDETRTVEASVAASIDCPRTALPVTRDVEVCAPIVPTGCSGSP
jgi:hypothetical protein